MNGTEARLDGISIRIREMRFIRKYERSHIVICTSPRSEFAHVSFVRYNMARPQVADGGEGSHVWKFDANVAVADSRQEVDCCEHGNKHLGSIKAGISLAS
jgi:hypothetical protein